MKKLLYRAGRKKPNILLILTDQQNARMMSCAGNKYLNTPAMDSIASNGVRFTRAYSVNPVCLPARTSMVTGYYSGKFGIFRNKDGKNASVSSRVLSESMGWLLRNGSYDTAYGGKTHFALNLKPEEFGFHTITDNDRDYLAVKCAEFIKMKRNKPFFLVASFVNPHDICYMAIDAYAAHSGGNPHPHSITEREELKKALQIPYGMSEEEFTEKWPPVPDNFEIPEDEPEGMKYGVKGFRAFVRENWGEKEWRRHRWAYCRLTERVDSQIGVVLNALKEAGVDEDTVIIFTSDHGDMDSAHRLEHKGVFYEESVGIPFIISWKGMTKAGVVNSSDLVCGSIDLIPTICSFAGVKPPEGLPGADLKRAVFGKKLKNKRKYVVSENESGYMLVTSDYKYCRFNVGKKNEWLINLKDDPGEMHNLAYELRYAGILSEHREMLREWEDSNIM